MVIEDWEEEKRKREERRWPTWFYFILFTFPAIATVGVAYLMFGVEILTTSIIGLAVMNGSINGVIAYMTIQLDTKSSESLQHLENINHEMDRLESTLEDANDKVQSFTGDLDEAKELFKKIGVDLTELDLEPVADVIENLKENKDGLNEVLTHLRDIDVSDYIDQAKRIDWKQLLSAAEDVMGFIQQKSPVAESPMSSFKPQLPTPIEVMDVPDDEDVDADPEWVEYSDSQWIATQTIEPEPEKPLSLEREPKRKPLSLERKPSKKLTLDR